MKVGKRRGFAKSSPLANTIDPGALSVLFLFLFCFFKEAKGNVANAGVAVQPALLVPSTKTKRH